MMMIIIIIINRDGHDHLVGNNKLNDTQEKMAKKNKLKKFLDDFIEKQ